MKFRHNSYLRKLGDTEYIDHIVEYNETDENYDCDWFELEDLTEDMIKDIVKLLNEKYSKEPYYKYKKKSD